MKQTFRFIVHIGTEKTGTTTLQGLLHQNQSELANQGYYYFASPGRVEARALAAAAMGDEASDDFLRMEGISTPVQRRQFRDAVVENFRATIESLGPDVHTVILSSEHFHSRLREDEQVEWLRALIEPFASEVQIVVYLRRQIDLLTSFYSTMLKNGSDLQQEQLARRVCRPANHYYNYRRLISLWETGFPYAIVCPRLFSTEALKGDDIITDFCDVIGFKANKLECGRAISRQNESLTPLGQDLLRGLNSERGKGFDSVAEEEFKAFSAQLIHAFSGRGQKLPLPLAQKLQSCFDESNAKLCLRWFPERDRLFDPVDSVNYQNPPAKNLGSNELKLVEEVIDCLERNEGRRVVRALNISARYLRDAGLALERVDVVLALKHMELARRIRPDGPLINQKYEEYSNRVTSGPQKVSSLAKRARLWFIKSL